MMLSLVFPCYREGPHLEQNIDRVINLLSLFQLPYEIILVDDYSPDNTRFVIQKILHKYSNLPIRAIFHKSNQGRGQAFMSGAAQSRGEYVGFFDIDLEVSPIYLFECFQKLKEENADLVVGQRHYKVNIGLFYRHILSSGYSWLVSKILKIPMKLDTESGYKFFKRSALQPYQGLFLHKGWFWDTEVVSRFVWDDKKIVTVPCLFIRNDEKQSTVRPVHDALEYLKHLLTYRSIRKKIKSLPRVIADSDNNTEDLAA